MITLQSLKRAVLASLSAQHRERSEDEKHLAVKRMRQHELQAAWDDEIERRKEADIDADGSRAATREALDEQREQQRLDEIAAGIIRRQAKLS